MSTAGIVLQPHWDWVFHLDMAALAAAHGAWVYLILF